jgi:hypothetical protein
MLPMYFRVTRQFIHSNWLLFNMRYVFYRKTGLKPLYAYQMMFVSFYNNITGVTSSHPGHEFYFSVCCFVYHWFVWIVLNATFNNMSGISWGSLIQSPLKEQLKNNNKTVVKNKRPHINILYTNLAIKGCDLLHSVLVLGIWIFFLDYAIQFYILFLKGRFTEEFLNIYVYPNEGVGVW